MGSFPVNGPANKRRRHIPHDRRCENKNYRRRDRERAVAIEYTAPPTGAATFTRRVTLAQQSRRTTTTITKNQQKYRFSSLLLTLPRFIASPQRPRQRRRRRRRRRRRQQQRQQQRRQQTTNKHKHKPQRDSWISQPASPPHTHSCAHSLNAAEGGRLTAEATTLPPTPTHSLTHSTHFDSLSRTHALPRPQRRRPPQSAKQSAKHAERQFRVST